MREIRQSGSEGGGNEQTVSPYPYFKMYKQKIFQPLPHKQIIFQAHPLRWVGLLLNSSQPQAPWNAVHGLLRSLPTRPQKEIFQAHPLRWVGLLPSFLPSFKSTLQLRTQTQAPSFS